MEVIMKKKVILFIAIACIGSFLNVDTHAAPGWGRGYDRLDRRDGRWGRGYDNWRRRDDRWTRGDRALLGTNIAANTVGTLGMLGAQARQNKLARRDDRYAREEENRMLREQLAQKNSQQTLPQKIQSTDEEMED